MPIEVKYLDDGKGFLFIGRGAVTGKDILRAYEEIYSSEEKTRKYKCALTDLSSITDFDVSTPEVEEIARLHMGVAEMNPDAVVAIAAPKDTAFGISRMWQAHVARTTWEIKVFRASDEAKMWIKERVKAKFGIDVTIT